MDITTIKNRLITLKTYAGLKKELINEIQDALLTKKKESEFSLLLKKVETEMKTAQSIRK